MGGVTAEIVDLSKRRTINADAIEKLEQALEWAKSGELQAVALAYTKPGGWVGQGWSEADNTALLLGAVALLSTRLAIALEAGADPPP